MNAPRGQEGFVSCELGDVVTLDATDFVIWQQGSCCSGNKGIFPLLFKVTSVCRGPSDCVLLNKGELLYPPDRGVWLSFVDSIQWADILSKFASVPEDSKFDPVREHVMELRRKWGITR